MVLERPGKKLPSSCQCPTVLTLSVLPPPARAPCVGQARSQRRLLSTKSEAVPAEGVVRLTLHRPEAQKGNSSNKKAPVVRKSYLAGLSRAAQVEFLCHCPKNLEMRTGVEFIAKDKPSQSQKFVKEEGRLGYLPNKDSVSPSNPPFLSYY